MEWTDRNYSAEPADAMCHCHVWDWRTEITEGTGNIGSVGNSRDLAAMQARMNTVADDGSISYGGISYGGPQNLAQCGHLICHRGGNPTYVFE